MPNSIKQDAEIAPPNIFPVTSGIEKRAALLKSDFCSLLVVSDSPAMPAKLELSTDYMYKRLANVWLE